MSHLTVIAVVAGLLCCSLVGLNAQWSDGNWQILTAASTPAAAPPIPSAPANGRVTQIGITRGMSDSFNPTTLTTDNFFGLFWTGDVRVGSGHAGKGETLELIFDTGSLDMWVVSAAKCSATANPSAPPLSNGSAPALFPCATTDTYDSTASPSYKAGPAGTFKEVYGAGTVSGKWANDVINVGDDTHGGVGPSISIPGANFGTVTNLQVACYWSCLFHGVFGLSRTYTNIPSPMWQSILAGQWAQPIFTVYYWIQGGPLNIGTGVVTLGGLDTTHCKAVVGWVPIAQSLTYLWGFNIDAAYLGTNATLTKVSAVAVTDTGGAVIMAPSDAFTALKAQLGLSPIKAGSSVNSIDCAKSYAGLTLAIGGKNYTIPKSTLTSNITVATSRCMFMVLPNINAPSQWYLGDAFFDSYCVVHDIGQNRMGFAPHS